MLAMTIQNLGDSQILGKLTLTLIILSFSQFKFFLILLSPNAFVKYDLPKLYQVWKEYMPLPPPPHLFPFSSVFAGARTLRITRFVPQMPLPHPVS